MKHRPKNIKISQALTAGNGARQFDDRLLDRERSTSVVTPLLIGVCQRHKHALPKRQKVEKSSAPFDSPSISRAAKATEVTGTIKVAVVPEGYPKVVLSSEVLTARGRTTLRESSLVRILQLSWEESTSGRVS